MQPALFRLRLSQGVAALAAALLAVSAAGCTGTPEPPPSPVPDLRIAAVGDMNDAQNLDPDSPSGRNGAAITQLVENNEIDAFLGLGDFQYSTAYCADYVQYWEQLWGGTKPKLYWVSAPNHDWEPGRNEDLDNFMNGQCPGSTAKAAINEEQGFIRNGKPYSKDFGNWHFAFLPSALWRFNPAEARRQPSGWTTTLLLPRPWASTWQPCTTSRTSHRTRTDMSGPPSTSRGLT
jgi:hypothetical protein